MYSYTQIADNYTLWQEYADPSGVDTEKSFNAKSTQDKIEILIACFGPEQKEPSHDH